MRGRLASKLSSMVKEEIKERKKKKTIKRGQTQRANQKEEVNAVDKALGFGMEEQEDKFVMPSHIREKIMGSMQQRVLAEKKMVSKSAMENLRKVQTLIESSKHENS